MSKIVELVPDGTLTATGWTTQAGNGASLPGSQHAALADNLPSTTKVTGIPYTRVNDVQAAIANDMRLTFNSYTLEADERCRRIQLSSIADERACRHRVGMGNGASTVERQGQYEHRSPTSGTKVEQLFGPWVNNAQDAGGLATLEWTQTNINDLRCRITPVSSQALGTAYFYRLRARLDIVQKAAPQFITPFEEEVFADDQPTLKWTTGVPESQKKVEIRLFTATVAEDDSFDINTSTAAIYTFKASTTSLTHRVGAGFLQQGQRYYAYVKVATDFNGTDWFSDWSPGVPFKLNAKPVVTVTAPIDPVTDTAKPIVTWTVTDEEGDLQSAYRVVILQKPALGWPGFVDPNQESLNGNAIYDSGLVSSEFTDHELPVALLNTVSYRAYVMVRQRVPSVLDSDWSYKDFTMQFSSPLAPSLRVTPISGATAIDLTVVPSLSNIMTADNSSFEGGVGTWIAGTNVTVAQNGANALHGTSSLSLTKTVSTATAQAFSDATSGGRPCTEGQKLSAFVYFKPNTTVRNCTCILEFMDVSNSIIDTQFGTTVTEVSGQWVRSFVMVPSVVAGAVRCRMRVDIASVPSGEIHFIDEAMIYAGSNSDQIPWDLGGGTFAVTLSPTSTARTVTRNWLTPNQASLETNTAGWTAGSGTTITRSTTQSLDGAASLRLERTTTTGDATATTDVWPNAIPVKPGDEVMTMTNWRSSATARIVGVDFIFYDALGNVLTHIPLENGFIGDTNSAFSLARTRAIAPTDAFQVAIKLTAFAIPTAEFHYVDKMMVHKGDTTVWSVGDANTIDVVDQQVLGGWMLLDWLPEEDICLAHRWDFVDDNECSWALWLLTDGKLRFDWSTDGTEGLRKSATSTAGVNFAAGSLNYFKVQFDNDNGAAGQNVSFFTGTTKASATTAVGTNPVTVATVESMFQGWADLQIDGLGFDSGGYQGYCVELELRDSATGAGNVLANGVFNLITMREWRDSVGRLWNLTDDAEMELKEEPNPDAFVLERSRDGGNTWEFFRYDTGILSNRIASSFDLFTIRDHEVPLNVPVQYRASALTTGLGFDSNSAPSTPISGTVFGNYVTLKSTKDPTLNRHFTVTDKWLNFRRTRNRTMFQPIGRRNPIVLRGHGEADAFTIAFLLLDTEIAAMEALLNEDALLFVQTPKRSWWVEIASDLDFSEHIWDRLREERDVAQLTVPFQEVDRLDGDSVASL